MADKPPQTPGVYLDFADQDPDVGPTAQIDGDKCPECDGEVKDGYGLMGGGLGHYVFCVNCDWMAKDQDVLEPTE